MSVRVPVPSSSSQLPAPPTATTTRRRVTDSQEDHCHVSTGGGGAVVYLPGDEEEATSSSGDGGGGGGGSSSCCQSDSHHNYLVRFLSLRKIRLVWMLMADNKSQWTAAMSRNLRSATNLGRMILSILGILVVTFFLVVALSGGGGGRRRHVEKHEFVVSIHPRSNMEKIIKEEESSSSSARVLLPERNPVSSHMLRFCSVLFILTFCELILALEHVFFFFFCNRSPRFGINQTLGTIRNA